MKRLLALVLVVLLLNLPASSYLNSFSGSTPDHWATPNITYSINPNHGSNIQGNRSVQDVVVTAFNTWDAAPNTSVTLTRGADSTKTSSGNDGVNLICFVCKGDFFQEASTLALTLSTTVSEGSDAGRIEDADIFFNPSVTFHTEGLEGAQDLQTVVVHEVGHLLGLDHTGVVKAVMFPFAPDLERTLAWDDVAAISSLYPGTQVAPVATMTGTVRLNGSPVFGAHVFAESVDGSDPFASMNIRKSPVSALTRPDGTYAIHGLPLGSYIVLAEPLDKPATNGDVSGYPAAFGRNAVQTNFTTRWH